MAHRLAAIARSRESQGKPTGRLEHYQKITWTKANGKPEWNDDIVFVREALKIPSRKKKPTTYFVNSMSDLFHENVKDLWRDEIFLEMGKSSHHKFLILTKRPSIASAYIAQLKQWFVIPSNVYIGTSIESDYTAKQCLDATLEIGINVPTFLSLEPLLSPVDLHLYFWHHFSSRRDNAPSQVIIGGESGHDARPFHLEWAIALIEECDYANVKVFFKQCGSNPYHKGKPLKLKSKKGSDLGELPDELRIKLNRRELI
jgi:protein gp37